MHRTATASSQGSGVLVRARNGARRGRRRTAAANSQGPLARAWRRDPRPEHGLAPPQRVLGWQCQPGAAACGQAEGGPVIRCSPPSSEIPSGADAGARAQGSLVIQGKALRDAVRPPVHRPNAAW
mmetsp:Transcript_144766/g.403389  ORF Transcript_144766/g.403389 Transcript_144766/m.403389 type:complete len:125 (-) Transcript_144766:277-651(-)